MAIFIAAGSVWFEKFIRDYSVDYGTKTLEILHSIIACCF